MKYLCLLVAALNTSALLSQEAEISPVPDCRPPARMYASIYTGYQHSTLFTEAPFDTPDGVTHSLALSSGMGLCTGVSWELIIGDTSATPSSIILSFLYRYSGIMEGSFDYERRNNEGTILLAGTAQSSLSTSFFCFGMEYRFNIAETPLGLISGLCPTYIASHSIEQEFILNNTSPPPDVDLIREGWRYTPASRTLTNTRTQSIPFAQLYFPLVVGFQYDIALRRMHLVPSVRYYFGLTSLFPQHSLHSRLSSINVGVDWRFAL